jgi:hypothetical protein
MSKEGDAEGRPLRTIFVKPFEGEMIKAGEIIEIVGHHSLGLSARRTANLLIHNAHGPALGRAGRSSRSSSRSSGAPTVPTMTSSRTSRR